MRSLLPVCLSGGDGGGAVMDRAREQLCFPADIPEFPRKKAVNRFDSSQIPSYDTHVHNSTEKFIFVQFFSVARQTGERP